MKAVKYINQFWKHNKKIYKELILNDFKTRYNGSFLGAVWGVIQPIVTILIYWIVFQYGLRSGERPDGMPYVVYMVTGAVPWFFFSEAWGSITTAFLDYSYLVKKLNFDIKLLPLVKLGSALMIHLVFLFIGVVITNIAGYYANFYYIQIFYYMMATAALAFALGMITSVINVYIRDTVQLINIILQIGFWANPICWGDEILPGNWRWIVRLNPFYYCVQGYRDSILYRKAVWEHPVYTMYFWGIVLILLGVSVYVFKKLRPYFADVL